MSRYAVATSPSPTREGFETQAYVPFEIVYFDHILSRGDVRELLTQSVGGWWWISNGYARFDPVGYYDEWDKSVFALQLRFRMIY